MLRDLINQLQQECQERRNNLDLLLLAAGLTQKDITNKVMRGEELPSAIAKEVFYLDSNAKLLNKLNYQAPDKSDWTSLDYLMDLFRDVFDWAEEHPDLLKNILSSGNLDSMNPVEDNTLFPAVLLSAIKRHERLEAPTSLDPEAA